MARKTYPASGFTLIELMIVAALAAVVGLAVMSTFASGIGIFARISTSTSAKAEALLAMERIERDIRNSFPYKDIECVGSVRKLTLPAIIRKSGEKGDAGESVGAVSYYVAGNEGSPALFREEKPYSMAVKKSAGMKGTATPVAAIEGVRFSYNKYDEEAGAYYWADYWDRSKDKEEGRSAPEKKEPPVPSVLEIEEKLPLAVKVEISYNDGGKELALERSVFLEQAVSLRRAKRKAEEKAQ